VDVPSVVEYASTLPDVVYAEANLFACSTDSALQISETIREKGINRLVVAACTPRTHETLFQETLREAGINGYCFVMANIREHSSWVHSRQKDKATRKAKDKVRMAVARAVNLSPLEGIEYSVTKTGLVLGGGLAGMTSALSIANQGYEVHLVERDRNLGGMARRISHTLEGMDVQAYLKELMGKVYRNPLIKIYTDAEILENSGYVGNFKTAVISDGKVNEIEHGITIIATGADEYKPKEYLYGSDDRVATLLEIEELIARNDRKVVDAKSMAIILCTGCRQDDTPHCSRVCCSQAIKCALAVKKVNPGIEIYILYRDMRTYGMKENYYLEAASQGVKFIRYSQDHKPSVEVMDRDDQTQLRVSVTDTIMEQKLVLDIDILGLAAAVVPRAENKKTSRQFKAPLNQDGFFSEAHMKLRPVDFATEGVYLCGTAHFPKFIDETISQAQAAAGRAVTILSKDKIISSGTASEVNEELCIGCGLCLKACQYGAVKLSAAQDGDKAAVLPALCQGCGACNSVCPTGAIDLNHFTDAQIFAEIDSVSSTLEKEGRYEPRIVAFLCTWCGYAGSDMAGVSRIQHAPNVREIRVMCTSRIHPKFVMEALLNGIDGVLICGCHLGDCHYMAANEQTEVMTKAVKETLKTIGINPERLRHEYISAAEGAKYARAVDSFTAFLSESGPFTLSKEQSEKLRELTVSTPVTGLG
jgi:heterodisulfide reductase subunit A